MFYWKYLFNSPLPASYLTSSPCFNPCFTGSTSSTRHELDIILLKCMFQSLFYWKYLFNNKKKARNNNAILVSILVLLEVPLQLMMMIQKYKKEVVSILVLLEVPLQLFGRYFTYYACESFNPCFTGSTSSTYPRFSIDAKTSRFNPCFTGSTSSTGGKLKVILDSNIVSILVLLEVPLQLGFFLLSIIWD